MGLYTSQTEHMYSYKSTVMVLLHSAGVKSYVDSSTLQSVMQTVTQSQQGQDKKRGVMGLGVKREVGGRRGSETQRQEEYRVKWRPAIKIVGTKDK